MAEKIEQKNPFVSITGITAGIYMIIVVVFMVAAKESLNLVLPIAWAFVVLGGLACFFAMISMKKK